MTQIGDYMKTATLPSLRVDPILRRDVESVLAEDETISKFTENAIRAQVELRKAQTDFISRGLASRNKALKTGVYISPEDALSHLKNMLDTAKKQNK